MALRKFLLAPSPLFSQCRSRSTLPLAYNVYETPASNSAAPPLVVNHGLFGSKSNWNSLCKVFHNKTQRKVVVPDARNHGGSPHSPDHTYDLLVADLKSLAEQLQLQRVALLGHSMGGRAAMLFALKHPHLVERLIVADISPMTTSPQLRSMPALFGALNGVELPRGVPMSVARAQVDAQLERAIQDRDLRSFLLTNLVEEDGEYRWRINIGALKENFEHVARFPPVGEVQYGGPVLFLAGGKSDFVPRDDHEGIRKLFPRAEFRYIDGAGHWLHSEKPAVFLEHTVEFLNRAE